ncbi:MAG TPA: hypothetical protein VGF12_18495 [Roseateles sp.]|uniref:hypothetical protein n=1 Tax=Roseateles sp. TaxID=1971397 RepID=UPI002EDB02B5
MKRFAHRLAILSTLILASTAAHAGAPLTTEDADVLGDGDCEAEATWARNGTLVDGLHKHYESGVKFGCGIVRRAQVGTTFGRSRSDTDLSDSLGISGKLSLLDSSDGGLGISVAWEMSAYLQRREASRWQSARIALVASQALGRSVRVHANLGAMHAHVERAETPFWGVAAEWSARDDLSLLVESYGERHAKPTLAIGLRFSPRELLTIGLLKSRAGGSPSWNSLGISVNLSL